MTWTFSTDLAACLATARPHLAAHPVRNTILLSALDALERRGPHAYGDTEPVFGWWSGADGTVDGAVLHTPPFPLLTGVLPTEAVHALGRALTADPLLTPVTGLNLRRTDARALTRAWGAPTRVDEELRLYRLGTLTAPDPAPEGRARRATEADLPLLARWCAEFSRECGTPTGPSEASLRDRVSYGGFLVWEHDGRPVSLGAFFRPIGSASRIGPVYTPPAERRHGYAAGVTHAVSEAAYAAGATEVLLFADLANPTSNGVYQRLGFTPVEDRVKLVRG
ncbi:GNAT family N-acetyltransferase [Streptomyces sp. NPDC001546]|uniref:GNAT family N-acetyltransferase n=1 Tax=Streptomyces sp. NPDC001546 TaxID=3364585 RepID=UPI00369E48AF